MKNVSHIVREIWCSVLGDQNHDLQKSIDKCHAFPFLREDLPAAAQLSHGFKAKNVQITPEDIIDHPNMNSQTELLYFQS